MKIASRRTHGRAIAASALILAINLAGSISWIIAHETPSDALTPIADPDPPYQAKGGWGPPRDTFTMENPSPYVTLNSITDHPNAGDTRNFFSVKPAEDSNASFANSLRIAGMRRYTAALYFENSASPGVNVAATNTRVQMMFPSTITGSARIDGIIRADGASPPVVWDSAILTLPDANDSVALRVVPDSAMIHSSGRANGTAVAVEQLFSDSGVLVGCDTLDGTLTGERKCEGWVTVDFITAQPSFTIESWVAASGLPNFATNQKVRPGDTLSIKIEYRNTGNVTQNDVVMRIESLPRCGPVVQGSTVIANSTSDGKWVRVSDGIDESHPVNIGSYPPGANAYLGFKIKLCDRDALSREYEHQWSSGSLWTKPLIKVGVETNNGAKSAKPMYLIVLGPNQR